MICFAIKVSNDGMTWHWISVAASTPCGTPLFSGYRGKSSRLLTTHRGVARAFAKANRALGREAKIVRVAT